MKTISVSASRKYDICIGMALNQCGTSICRVTGCQKAVIVSDSNVAPLYLDQVTHSLQRAGCEVHSFLIPAGEASKCAAQYLRLLNSLTELQFTRTDVLVALGGGVVGDLTGFAAATYLRGVAFVQLPTSLLAMVDSSVGGKTAIDLLGGKNLCGAFYQPWAVLCDPDVLNTLPSTCCSDGSAEIIKYALLRDPELLSLLRQGKAAREEIIARSCSIKRDLVEQDERDNGVRQLLNLGHTVGHAFEQYSGYALSHGRAVAAGMAVITRAAIAHGDCDSAVWPTLKQALLNADLPIAPTAPLSALATLLRTDKKRQGDHLTLVIPQSLGQCGLRQLPLNQLEDYLQPGFKE